MSAFRDDSVRVKECLRVYFIVDGSSVRSFKIKVI